MGTKRVRMQAATDSAACLHTENQTRLKTDEQHPPQTGEAGQRQSSELEVHQIELEVQNTELCRVQEAMELQQVELEMQNDELRRVQETLETQQVELVMQNDELRRTQQELESSRNK